MSKPIADLKLLIGSTETSLTVVVDALALLPADQFLVVVKAIVQAGRADEIKELVDGIEIMTTPSAFDSAEKKQILEQTAGAYPLAFWLKQTNKALSRDSLVEWWEFFMVMASERGYKPQGFLSCETGTNLTLWKATKNLAIKMLRIPKNYAYLPAVLVNNAEQVSKALVTIGNNPYSFIELLTGEAWEDIVKSPEFCGAFSTLEGENKQENCIATLMLALQQSAK